jgi:hypothetical protein
MLDLDHVGTKVAEQRGGQWPSEDGRDVQDAYAFQGRW